MRPLFLAALLAASTLAGEGWVTHAVALSPDLKTVVRGRMHAERGTSHLRIENAETGAVRVEQSASGPVRAFAFRGDGACFVATNDHGPLRVIDTATGKLVGELAGHRGWVHTIAFAGRHVASAGYSSTLRLWDAERGAELWRKADTRVGALALSPDGTRLATADDVGRVHLWDAATGKQLHKLDTGDNRWGFVVAFSGDGTRVAAGNRRIRVFLVETGKVLATLEVDKKRVTAIAFSGNGSRLATAGADRRVRLWRLADARVERTWTVKQGVGALVFSADGLTLGAATHYGKCHHWDLPTGREVTGLRAGKTKR